MNPRPDNEHLSAWLDGELDEAEGALLEAELARDPELRAELQSLEAVIRLLREDGPTQAPLGFQHRVMARVEHEFPERPSWWVWLRRPWGIPLEGWVLGLAAAAALLLVLPIWRSGPPSDSDGVAHELSPAAVEAPKLAEPIDLPSLEGKELESDKKGQGEKAESKLIGRATTGEDSVPKALPKDAPTEVAGTEAVTPDLGKTATPDPVDPTSPYQVVVTSEDAGMKREILAIASRYGTGATDVDDNPIHDSAMRAGSEELIVSLSQADLASFAKDVASKGYLVDTVNQGMIVGGSTVSVRLTLNLVGGAPGTDGDLDPKAARKQMDELEAAPPDSP